MVWAKVNEAMAVFTSFVPIAAVLIAHSRTWHFRLCVCVGASTAAEMEILASTSSSMSVEWNGLLALLMPFHPVWLFSFSVRQRYASLSRFFRVSCSVSVLHFCCISTAHKALGSSSQVRTSQSNLNCVECKRLFFDLRLRQCSVHAKVAPRAQTTLVFADLLLG